MSQEQLSPAFTLKEKIYCAKCGEKLVCASTRMIEMFICPACYGIQDKSAQPIYEKIKITVPRRLTKLKLGDHGTYKGKAFQIIGIANKREDSYYSSEWWEMTAQWVDGELFFISVWNGHYTFLEQVDFKDVTFNETEYKLAARYKDKQFSFFSKYGYKTQFANGAFPYDVIDVSKSECFDYIAPPLQLSIEKDKNGEMSAFLGEYLTPKEVSKIFERPALAVYDRNGVAPAQPFYWGLNVTTFNRISAVFLIMFTLLTVMLNWDSTSHIMYQKRLALNDSLTSREIVSNSFELKEKLTPYFLSFEGYAAVNNNWTEIQTSLINENTGIEKELAVGIEYYSGVDNGYSWSEGSTLSTVYLSGVEPGKYHLKTKFLKPIGIGDYEVRLTVRTDSPWSWNFRVLIIPFGILWILLNILSRQFERMRSGEIDSLFESSE